MSGDSVSDVRGDVLTSRVLVADHVSVQVYEWVGDDVPILLLHGLASNARVWDPVADLLAERGHRVVSVDLRGHGRSDAPPAGYDLASLTDDLLALLDATSLDRPVVAGHSWGGNIALELGWRAPERVRAIAAVDGGIIELSPRFPTWEECLAVLGPRRLDGRTADRVRAAIRSAHPEWSEQGIAAAMANFEILEDGTVRPWLTYEHHLEALHGLWQHRPSSRFAELDVPVLLLPSDHDNVVWTDDKRAAVEAALAELPRASARWFADSDHDLHVEQPRAVAEELAAVAKAANAGVSRPDADVRPGRST